MLLSPARRWFIVSLTAVLAAGLAGTGVSPVRAQTLNWDPSFTATATGGGPGTWDTITANWFNGTTDVSWPGAGNVAVFGGPTSGLVSIASPGVSADGLTFNTDGYIIGGPGTLTLTGAGTFTVGSGVTSTVNTAIAGSVGLTMAGPGTLVLGGANTYTGTTTINAGTIQVNSGGSLGAAANGLLLGNAAGTLNTAANVVFNTSATIGSFLATTQTTVDTVTIAGSQTLTINGATTLGVAATSATATVTSVTMTGGGGLNIAAGAANFNLAPSSNNNAFGAQTAVLNLAGLSSFSFSSTGSFQDGFGIRSIGTLTLANTGAATNSITASTVNVGNSNNGNNSGASTLNLGGGTNTIDATTVTIGAGKSAGTLQFVSGAPATAALTIAGTAGGASTSNISVGVASSATWGGGTAKLLLAGHPVAVQGGTVIIGQLSGATGGTSTTADTGQATFDTGAFSANTLTIGSDTSGADATGIRSSFTVGTTAANTGVLTVNTAFNLGNVTSTVAAHPDRAAFTINGGTANVNADINSVNSSATITLTSVLTLAGGTLNMNGHQIGHAAGNNRNITTVTMPAAGQIATLLNLGGTGINDAGLTMNGAGTLILAGTNSYSGGTTLSTGQLNLNSAGALGTGTFTIAGGTLGNSSGVAVTLSGNNAQTWSGDFTFAGPNDLNLGTGAVTLTANRQVTVSAGNLTVGGAIGDSSSAFSLTKLGAGTLTLAGANTYTGTTTVSAGTLRLAQSLPYTAPAGFAVAGAAGLSIVNGAGTSTLTVPTLSLGASGGNSVLGFELNTSTLPTSPLLTVSTPDGLTFNGGTHTINIFDQQPAPIGSFPLIAYSGAPITSGFTLGNLPTPRTVANLDYSTAGQIKLNITGVDTLIWAGNVSANWDVGSSVNVGGTQNWKLASNGNSTNFVTGDVVTFNDTATTFNVNVTTAVQPASVTVNNATNTYTFSGPGSITGSEGLTKQGAGTLILVTDNTYAGSTTVSAGTLQLGNGGTTGSITGDLVDNGAVAFNRSDNITYAGNLSGSGSLTKAGTNTLTLTGAYGLTGPITVSGGTLVLGSGATYSLAAAIGGAGGLTKDGAGTLTLTGANTYAGPTAVVNGILSVASINSVAGGAASSNLGAPTTAANGTISLGSGATAGTLQYTGAGETTDRVINLAGTTGGGTIDQSGGGLLKFTGSVTATGAGGKTLTLTGAGTGEIAGAIVNGSSSIAITKAGAGAWTLSGANTYSGGTTILGGTLAAGADNALGSGALVFGDTSAATGNLNLNTFNQTVSSVSVLSNTATANDIITVGPGKTLTVNGAFSVGAGGGAAATTGLVMTGGGTLTVVNLAANGTFVIGGVPTAGVMSKATADLSGLAALNVTLNTTNGVFRVNPTNGTNVNDSFSVLTLPAASTIVASALNVGDSSMNNGSAGQTNQLKLGSGVTTLNVNAINVGTGSRDAGSVTFAGAGGSVVVRDTTGTGRAALNIGTGTSATGITGNHTFDVTGHSADLLLSTLAVATQPRSTTYTGTFAFDQGNLDVSSLTAATTTQAAESANGANTPRIGNANINLGGGTVAFQNGILNLGLLTGTGYTNAAEPHTVNGTVNVSGGTVSIGATAGNAVTMATLNFTGTANVANLAATGTLNLTGGTTTVQGNIVKGGNIGTGTTSGTATATANLTVNGGTLDVSGFAIGSAATPIDNVNLQAGTLKNVGEINGGGPVTKTGPGTLTLAGTNTYTGPTTVAFGTLAVAAGATLASPAIAVGTAPGSTAVFDVSAATGFQVGSGKTLSGFGAVTGPITIAAGGTVAPGASAGTLSFNNGLTVNGTYAWELATAGNSDPTFTGQSSPALPHTNHDVLNVTGPLNFSGSIVNLTSLPSTGFNNTQPYSWQIALGSTIASLPTIGTISGADFINPPGTFSVSNAGNMLLLNYNPTPVPEPAFVLAACGGLTILAGWRKRRQSRM